MTTPPLAIVADVFLAAAKRHGEDSEPDHEAGDIQEFFRATYKLLTPIQRERFAANQGVNFILDAAGVTIDPSADAEAYIDTAESFGKASETELTSLKSFFSYAFEKLDAIQRRALIDDEAVQETLQNAAGIIDIEPNDAITIYTAIAEDVLPKNFSPR